MGKLNKQALMYAENLSLPSFQVIVISANLSCACCRQRVSQLTSKLTGLREYTMNVRNQQVIVKGDVKFSCSASNGAPNPRKKKKMKNDRLPFKFKFSMIRFLRATCITRCFACLANHR